VTTGETQVLPGAAFPLSATPMASGVNCSVFANKAEAMAI
jgi:hypothetical protein